MSQSITISVPDDLYEQIQKYRSQLTISKTCQEALMDQVARIEMAETEDLIGFLKSGRNEYMERFVIEGREFAKDSVEAKEVTYASFVALNELSEFCQNGDHSRIDHGAMSAALFEAENDALWDILEEHLTERQKEDGKFDSNAFLYGFVEEASEIWFELKNKI